MASVFPWQIPTPTLLHPIVFDVAGNVPTMEPVAVTGVAGIFPAVQQPVVEEERSSPTVW